MIAAGEEELFCDLAETYHVIGFDSYPVGVIATLAAGLGEGSRIMQKLMGVTYPPLALVAAHIADDLKLFRYSFLDTKKAPEPYLFLEHIQKQVQETTGFSTPQEFIDNWNKNNERGMKIE